MVNVFNGDVFDAPIDSLVHCANCFHTMGSGIARGIREEYPEAYEADVTQTKKGDPEKLGTFSCAEIQTPTRRRNPRLKFIYNLYGQFTFGRDRRQVNYEAIYSGFQAVRSDIECGNDPKEVLGINYKLGCNLAGGDWNVVLAMIHSVFDKASFDVLICKRPEDV
jgi:hypothetical protein